MKDELITYETAKLAKEKGFVNGSKSYYSGNDELETYDEEFHPNVVLSNNFMQRFRYEAPTQSLLQKWLRDEHKLYIQPFYDDPEWRVSITNPEEDILGEYEQKENMNYEEALEKGLIEALKLIE